MKNAGLEFLKHNVVICILLVPAHCGWSNDRICTPQVKMNGPQGVCGTVLENLLSVVCDGIYNKRSGQTADFSTADMGAMKSGGINEKLISKRSAYSLLVKKSEYEDRGIVCECCYHSCHFGELMQYCGPRIGYDFKKRLWKGSRSLE